MEATLLRLVRGEDEARRQAEHGLETILARHSCDHRADELLHVVHTLGAAGSAGTRPTAETACI